MLASAWQQCASRCCRWQRVGVISFALLLAACASDPPPVPPAELVALQPSAAIEFNWRASGLATGRSELQPLPLSEGLYVASRQGVVKRLNRETGKTVWTKSLQQTLGAGVGGDGKNIYVSTEDGTVHALDSETGVVVLRRSSLTPV